MPCFMKPMEMLENSEVVPQILTALPVFIAEANNLKSVPKIIRPSTAVSHLAARSRWAGHSIR